MTPDARLAHVYWVGGAPCAGKSTVVDNIAAQHGMTVYRCDDAWYRHSEVASPDAQPVLHRLAHATPDDIWLRPVQQQITEEIAQYREEFPMILEDILRLPNDRPVIAEGAALMPDVLLHLEFPARRKLWMIPTEAFQRHHYAQRAWRHDVLRESSDPERAWANWMARDTGFAQEVARQARENGEHLIVVDESRDIDSVERDVMLHFDLL